MLGKLFTLAFVARRAIHNSLHGALRQMGGRQKYRAGANEIRATFFMMRAMSSMYASKREAGFWSNLMR